MEKQISKMKLVIVMLLAAVLAVTAAGCGKKEPPADAQASVQSDSPDALKIDGAANNTSVNGTAAADGSVTDGTAADDTVIDGAEGADGLEPVTEPAKRTYTAAEYEEAGVNELNSVPILMYHRIYNMTNAETDYIGGNVDADGYNRTAEAFEADLEFYYKQGYQMMRLTDYVDGNIDVDFGKSPLILTFDDGIRNAVIEGFDDNGNPIFESGCAMGILEKMKKKYPDFHVTATFFLNNFLFEENSDESPRLMKWMVDNGYDIGNHTWSHEMLGHCTADEIEYQVGAMYQLLDEIIPGQYVNIVALPYGSPASMDGEPQYDKIFSGTYDGFSYTSKGALLCAWTRAYSPFTTSWDITCIRRIRGYDNNGEDFDIQFNFEQLNQGKRYISDGDPDTIVIRADEEEGWLGETYGKEVIRY